jgi:hypothetical protein
MNKQVLAVPTAHIAINKSRIKVYNKNTECPSVYLQKGQEFSIELFNPTTDVILCEIHLNNKQISQGGLVLNPGQRVFLDRYLDVAKKFLFDTYEVANTAEVKEAIEQNGDFKVKFYRENRYTPPIYRSFSGNLSDGSTGNVVRYGDFNTTLTNNITYNSDVNNMTLGMCCMDSFNDFNPIKKDLNRAKLRRIVSNKSIETGRVEKGSDSDQKLTTVDKKWEYTAFHTVEYKMLPVSQKVNTLEDIQVAKYCTNCGGKTHKTDKFCAKCGKKI